MPSTLQALKLLSDSSRVRVLLLVGRDELSVAELQESLAFGQSRISTYLAQLRRAELVEDRRVGKHVRYRLAAATAGLLDHLLEAAAKEIPEHQADLRTMRLVLERRRDQVRAYFNNLAGKFGHQYVPGRSWRGLAEALLELLPPLVIADLGAGEGSFSQLLARRAERVIAVDSSERMVEVGRTLAAEHGLTNVDYRVGDMEAPPIGDAEVDLAFFSQSLHHARHPGRAVQEAARILRPGGRIAILDLAKHHIEEAREMYADEHLGFSEVELRDYLEEAGFRVSTTAVVHREEQAPYFETLLAVGVKP
jgi:ArsR family transcriptional regulator